MGIEKEFHSRYSRNSFSGASKSVAMKMTDPLPRPGAGRGVDRTDFAFDPVERVPFDFDFLIIFLVAGTVPHLTDVNERCGFYQAVVNHDSPRQSAFDSSRSNLFPYKSTNTATVPYGS